MNKMGLLNADEMAAFNRFCECCEDFDSGGYDVDKAMMLQLARIGVVRSTGFGRYETTAFGDIVRGYVTAPSAPMGEELPKWIDDHKGADPFMDDVIAYIESMQSRYAERIRQLERELADLRLQYIADFGQEQERGELAERKTASIDSPEFSEEITLFLDVHEDGSDDEYRRARARLIAYIDGRTAGGVPEGYALAPLKPTETMLKAAVLAFQSGYRADDSLADWRAAYESAIAAAPTPMNSGKEEGNGQG